MSQMREPTHPDLISEDLIHQHHNLDQLAASLDDDHSNDNKLNYPNDLTSLHIPGLTSHQHSTNNISNNNKNVQNEPSHLISETVTVSQYQQHQPQQYTQQFNHQQSHHDQQQQQQHQQQQQQQQQFNQQSLQQQNIPQQQQQQQQIQLQHPNHYNIQQPAQPAQQQQQPQRQTQQLGQHSNQFNNSQQHYNQYNQQQQQPQQQSQQQIQQQLQQQPQQQQPQQYGQQFQHLHQEQSQQYSQQAGNGMVYNSSHLQSMNDSPNTSSHGESIGSPGIGDPNEYLITPMIEEQIFDNVNVLKEFVKEFGKKNEFGIAIAHSNNKAIYFTCELGGSYREKRSKRSPSYDENDFHSKKIGTKKIKCPFAMVANYSKKKSYWTLRISENKHNHPKLDPLVNFPMLRKRSSHVNLTIKELYSAGDKPSVIHQKLSAIFPDLIIKREDIYNEIRILKKKGLVPTSSELKNRKITEDQLDAHYGVQHHQLQQQVNENLAWAEAAYLSDEQKKHEVDQANAAVAAALKEEDKADHILHLDERLLTGN